MIFHKGTKAVQWKNKWCWRIWIYTCKRIKLNPYLTTYENINSKCIKDLNVRSKTIKPIEENIGMKVHNLELGNGCLAVTAKAEETTTKRHKLNITKF